MSDVFILGLRPPSSDTKLSKITVGNQRNIKLICKRKKKSQ